MYPYTVLSTQIWHCPKFDAVQAGHRNFNTAYKYIDGQNIQAICENSSAVGTTQQFHMTDTNFKGFL